MATEERYKLKIQGTWSLEDLYVFPRAYEQVYFAIYSLMEGEDRIEAERISQAYRTFPWQGGYSAVSFYNQLKYLVPRRERPQIASIEYHSPGWLELTLAVSVALNIEKIVKSVCASFSTINQTYNEIMKGMQERELLRIKVQRKKIELEKDDLRYVEESTKAIAKILAINPKEINEMTGHPYRSLKILLSLYRRVRTLSKYKMDGKADFTQ